MLEKDRLKKTKRSLSNNFSAFSGVPPLSFSITIRLFKDLDIDRLLFTMQDQIDKHYTETYIEDLRIAEYQKQFQNNLPKAFMVSFLFSIVFGIGYGFSIQLLNKNLLAIPLFSSILIISIFNKYCEEPSVNILLRLSLGVLCLFQMITGLITAVMLAAKLHINLQNILVVMQNYMEYFISSPWENVPIFIWGLMCLGMGIFHGSIKIKARN